ncbi:hypothetical protein J437_LFUL007403 [Ladona fulva]|uniref:HAT C-terminal dimerisation domain-containing protein n=1 Tax=Ladona fulva TaxID=123851 RepID=A0A8K0K1J7_LADFU|nr:hypothetical protein J437_LFUL007403 [Ladona fulva]
MEGITGRKRSAIWLHFTAVSAEKAKVEPPQIKTTKTSELKASYKDRRINVPATSSRVLPIPDCPPNFGSSSAMDQSANTSKDTVSSPVSSTFSSIRQSTMSNFVVRPMSVIQQKKINNLILNMIIMDLQPFSIVEDEGFKNLVTGIDPSYQLPSRAMLTRTLLPQKYESTVEALKMHLSRAESITLTTDGWTSTAKEAYLAITAHFISEKWETFSALLDCFRLDGRHTAEKLSSEIKRISNYWEIEDKIYAVVTDNAPNITSAVRVTGWAHLPCFAHTINLVVQNGLSTIKHDISPQANERLILVQQQMAKEPQPLKLKITKIVITRWNSTYHMFQRICDIQEAVEATLGMLHNPVECLSKQEWDTLREMCSILKPFEEVTVELSSEKTVSVSKVIVIARGLMTALNRLKSSLQMDASLQLVEALLKAMSPRFNKVEYNLVLSKAFLDPRFKRNAFSENDSWQTIKQRIINDAEALIVTHDKEVGCDTAEDDSAIPVEESLIWHDFDRKASSSKSSQSRQTTYIKERKFFGLVEIYPRLSKLAKKHLAVVATSVPSERVFSKAGQIISERRS